MERYGSSWEEYITLIFLSEDPSGLSGQLYLAQLAWGRGEEQNHCGPLFQILHPKLHKGLVLSDVKSKCSCF